MSGKRADKHGFRQHPRLSQMTTDLNSKGANMVAERMPFASACGRTGSSSANCAAKKT